MGAVRAAWDAAEHPRGAGGKFAPGTAGGRVHVSGRGRARVMKATVMSDRDRRLRTEATYAHNANLERMVARRGGAPGGSARPASLRQASQTFAEKVNRKVAGQRKPKAQLRITDTSSWFKAKPGHFRR